MKLHIVLFEPEIPQNTGNIMRTCMATNSRLHLIQPLGFSLTEKALKRAGLDYLDQVDYRIYPNWSSFTENCLGKFVYITRYSKTTPKEYPFKDINEDIYLVFGKESSGLPLEILTENLDDCVRLPMVASARSLNLSNCVAIMTYHVLAEFNYLNLATKEVIKGEDWIFNKR